MASYLTLAGTSTVSSFRLARVLEQLRAIDERVDAVSEQAVHWVWCDRTPDAAQRARLEALLADLLLLASVDEGSSSAGGGGAPVALDEVAAAEVARRRCGPVAVRLVGPDDGGAAVVVRGHRMQLERVVANLVDNAVRHARSRVEVRVERDAASASAVVVVDDDGPGIAVGHRERVFERFTRLDEGRSRDAGGAGLGLALVRGIVGRHGGSVVVSDAPAGGARLEVRLPLLGGSGG